MVRNKDLLTPALLRQRFPFVVEIPLPLMGFRHRLVLMEQWLTDYSETGDYGRWGARREQQDIAAWGFRDEVTAAAFRASAEMILKLTERQVGNRLAKRGY
jgi:hypothetical protein